MKNGKTYCLIYTCARDVLKAQITAACVPLDWKIIWCVESKDRDLPLPRGEVIIRDFPRGAQLRFIDALRGMRGVFLELAERMTDNDLLIKLDSDTTLYRPESFTAPFFFGDVDFTYIRRNFNEGRFTANGSCYAVSKRAILRLKRLPEKRFEESARRYEGHEDRVFSSFWTTQNIDLTYCQLDKAKCDWHYRRYLGADSYLGHWGYFKETEMFDGVKEAFERRGMEIPLNPKMREWILSAIACCKARREREKREQKAKEEREQAAKGESK